MKSKAKYAIIGLVLGGFLPALLHPLKITVFASIEGVIFHIIGGLAGISIGLLIWLLKSKIKGK